MKLIISETVDMNLKPVPSGDYDRVLVLIMAYRRALSDYEHVSLRQCMTVLKDHPIRIVKPQSLDLSEWPIDQSIITYENFPDEAFRHVGTYSRLLLSLRFYKRFLQFEYVLIYQLDAFVFSDQLLNWCNKGYDYIGAPWFENFSSTDKSVPLMGVGNGGFSLRKVSTHIRVLKSFAYLSLPGENWRKRMEAHPRGISWVKQAVGFLLDQVIRNNTYWLLNSYMGFEDQFWSLVVPKRFKWFRMPGVKEAMKFSFEMQPYRVFEMNDDELPFGCHAWWKYDLAFWKPHIEALGYRL